MIVEPRAHAIEGEFTHLGPRSPGSMRHKVAWSSPVSVLASRWLRCAHSRTSQMRPPAGRAVVIWITNPLVDSTCGPTHEMSPMSCTIGRDVTVALKGSSCAPSHASGRTRRIFTSRPRRWAAAAACDQDEWRCVDVELGHVPLLGATGGAVDTTRGSSHVRFCGGLCGVRARHGWSGGVRSPCSRSLLRRPARSAV